MGLMSWFRQTQPETEWSTHAWGLSKTLCEGPLYRVDWCVGLQGRSSIHKHEHASNMFHVVQGSVGLHREGFKKVVLNAGDSLTVPKGDHHALYVIEPCLFLEVYTWDAGKAWDISRMDKGNNIPVSVDIFLGFPTHKETHG